MDTVAKPLKDSSIALTEEQIHGYRLKIVETAKSLLGIKYEREDNDPMTPWTGKGKWLNLTKPPESLDCSGLASGAFQYNGFKMPHGSQNQFNFTIATETPRIGDLAFFAKEKNVNRIYHVGILVSITEIIEAREFDPNASFETGKVILRPRQKWENWKDFAGFRAHPRLV